MCDAMGEQCKRSRGVVLQNCSTKQEDCDGVQTRAEWGVCKVVRVVVAEVRRDDSNLLLTLGRYSRMEAS